MNSILKAFGAEAFRCQVNLRLRSNKGRALESESEWMMLSLHCLVSHSEDGDQREFDNKQM